MPIEEVPKTDDTGGKMEEVAPLETTVLKLNVPPASSPEASAALSFTSVLSSLSSSGGAKLLGAEAPKVEKPLAVPLVAAAKANGFWDAEVLKDPNRGGAAAAGLLTSSCVVFQGLRFCKALTARSGRVRSSNPSSGGMALTETVSQAKLGSRVEGSRGRRRRRTSLAWAAAPWPSFPLTWPSLSSDLPLLSSACSPPSDFLG